MAEIAEIKRIALEVVKANIASQEVRLDVQDTVDWAGDPVIKISVVLPDEAMDKFDGEASIKVLSEINDRLERVGDSRFAMIDYATQSELDEENAAP